MFRNWRVSFLLLLLVEFLLRVSSFQPIANPVAGLKGDGDSLTNVSPHINYYNRVRHRSVASDPVLLSLYASGAVMGSPTDRIARKLYQCKTMIRNGQFNRAEKR